jgi:hypothetical protein
MNIKGGCWSYKINDFDNISELWQSLCSNMMMNSIIDNNDELNGISITFKNSHYIIKIWVKNNIKFKLNNYIKNYLCHGIYQYHNKSIKKDHKKKMFYSVSRRK